MAVRNRSTNWHRMADEARAIAASMHDEIAKRTMLEIADRYEVLAKYAENQAIIEDGDPPGPIAD